MKEAKKNYYKYNVSMLTEGKKNYLLTCTSLA